ncbi:mannitol dehydrogenase family protein [Arthrobacter sp. ISL-30]|uniref:mannitol dehydrogenase family protein n=1 Tax=Arthrobacter sp. ISL-30 TaxID=2819109 RepID=UPI001BE66BD3|nr:mannitol dehydrogenase family protein [Arthrobacter sp. ISL-30]MBT2514811.1 mannitol dehydrogenase family protein [Arthrobacter sp. ISL-30]
MTAAQLPALSRGPNALPKAPVRIVHVGLGAFHRSHQAWYTQHASDAAEWGIAAFTGRRPDAALALAAQDGLYTLIERSDDGDSFEVIGSIVEASDGADVGRLAELLAAPATAIVTLTITEAGYGLGRDGTLDNSSSAVAADIESLREPDGGTPATPLGRLVLGLAARRTVGGGPIAVVSCDNLADNGNVARAAVCGMAEAWDPGLAAWIKENVSFVGTSVDRITPRTTEADVAAVAEACGHRDTTPVVAEPFHNWILSGGFPAGRPRWEESGALFVDDIEPYENRKLWLLNGAHSMLAYAGGLVGHTTVAEALGDGRCLSAVEALWDEASAHLTGPGLRISEYRAALLERFSNSRIAHHLSQIAMDGTTKLRMRAVPVLRAERAVGRTGEGAARMIAAWIDYVGATSDIHDPLAADIASANSQDGDRRLTALLSLVSPELARDPGITALVRSLCGTFTGAYTPANP